MLALAAGAGSLLAPANSQAWVPGSDGDIVYASNQGTPADAPGEWHIWSISPDGTNKRQLTHGNDTDPSWSPSGRHIAFSRLDDDGSGPTPEWRIWVMNADGSHQHALTPPGTPGDSSYRGNSLPRYSPDGEQIAFKSRVLEGDDGAFKDNIWVMNADGSDLHQITDLPDTAITDLSWAPDGQHLVFEALDLHWSPGPIDFLGTNPRLLRFYEMTADGGGLHQLAFDPDQDAFRPFGCGVIFSTPFHYSIGLDWSSAGLATGGCDKVRIATPDLGRVDEVGSTDCRLSPSWSPDARNLACETSSGQLAWEAPSATFENQITSDTTTHAVPSWGPTPKGGVGTPITHSTVAFARPVELGQRSVSLLLSCPQLRTGCADLVTLLAGGRSMESQRYRLSAERTKAVRLRLSNATRHSLKAGERIGLRLRAKSRRHTAHARAATKAYAPALLTSSCPNAAVQAGKATSLSGSLRTARRGTNLVGTSGATVGLTATSPSGAQMRLNGKTDARGHYRVVLTPDVAGSWNLQAVWDGNSAHAFASSASCGVVVKPIKTALTISAPKTISLGSTLTVNGNLSPALDGAPITLTYSHGSDTFTTVVNAAPDGSFSDSTFVPPKPGDWSVRAGYAGDNTHAVSASSSTTTSVS